MFLSVSLSLALSLSLSLYIYIHTEQPGTPGGSVVINPPANAGDSILGSNPWVRSLDQEDLLEKQMATHSSILASEIPWTEEPGGLLSMGVTKVSDTI